MYYPFVFDLNDLIFFNLPIIIIKKQHLTRYLIPKIKRALFGWAVNGAREWTKKLRQFLVCREQNFWNDRYGTEFYFAAGEVCAGAHRWYPGILYKRMHGHLIRNSGLRVVLGATLVEKNNNFQNVYVENSRTKAWAIGVNIVYIMSEHKCWIN